LDTKIVHEIKFKPYLIYEWKNGFNIKYSICDVSLSILSIAIQLWHIRDLKFRCALQERNKWKKYLELERRSKSKQQWECIWLEGASNQIWQLDNFFFALGRWRNIKLQKKKVILNWNKNIVWKIKEHSHSLKHASFCSRIKNIPFQKLITIQISN
jgi:hypothetical protein